MVTDDLPWPELGNVSRGATRGNQGQKGVLGSPDSEGRAVLQLRVQPGVLAVRLNRQSTEWYHKLDNEVNQALKLTKTYWRKARRRQDYDARADQDHMELHEWLQQLKDKVMTHLELLMQKGEIQGPPYIMPDDIELTFMKKFIERQAAGIPHNPRLRQSYLDGHSPQRYPSVRCSESTGTPSVGGWDGLDDADASSESDAGSTTAAASSPGDVHSLLNEVKSNHRALKNARAMLSRAQKETQDIFAKYKSFVDAEAKALQSLTAAEERRDALLSSLVDTYRGLGMEAPDASKTLFSMDFSASFNGSEAQNEQNKSECINGRKHSRSWEDQRDDTVLDDITSFPPRKRHQFGTDDHLLSSSRTISTTRHSAFPLSEARPNRSLPSGSPHAYVANINM